LQISFCKRAIDHRAFLRRMTYKDKASYASSPPSGRVVLLQCAMSAVSVHTHACVHVWVFIPAFGCLFLRLGIYTCVWVSAFGCLYLRAHAYVPVSLTRTPVWMCANSEGSITRKLTAASTVQVCRVCECTYDTMQ